MSDKSGPEGLSALERAVNMGPERPGGPVSARGFVRCDGAFEAAMALSNPEACAGDVVVYGDVAFACEQEDGDDWSLYKLGDDGSWALAEGPEGTGPVATVRFEPYDADAALVKLASARLSGKDEIARGLIGRTNPFEARTVAGTEPAASREGRGLEGAKAPLPTFALAAALDGRQARREGVRRVETPWEASELAAWTRRATAGRHGREDGPTPEGLPAVRVGAAASEGDVAALLRADGAWTESTDPAGVRIVQRSVPTSRSGDVGRHETFEMTQEGWAWSGLRERGKSSQALTSDDLAAAEAWAPELAQVRRLAGGKARGDGARDRGTGADGRSPAVPADRAKGETTPAEGIAPPPRPRKAASTPAEERARAATAPGKRPQGAAVAPRRLGRQ